ncbi:hypothetical protein I7I51_02183 [Histoplasma capsulatum]|uniref:Uncharacterized protein n=1 Tax=Ajellomyces capsulatus TaxID=5037 RepID=A0A8A1M7F7_AJECA|nr:hypothetical protein I7I51_02183 [Histoplasma capsulatum]
MVAATDPLRESHSETNSPNGTEQNRAEQNPPHCPKYQSSLAQQKLYSTGRSRCSGSARHHTHGAGSPAMVPIHGVIHSCPWICAVYMPLADHHVPFHARSLPPMQAPNARRHKRAISEGWNVKEWRGCMDEFGVSIELYHRREAAVPAAVNESKSEKQKPYHVVSMICIIVEGRPSPIPQIRNPPRWQSCLTFSINASYSKAATTAAKLARPPNTQ